MKPAERMLLASAKYVECFSAGNMVTGKRESALSAGKRKRVPARMLNCFDTKKLYIDAFNRFKEY